MKDTKQESSGAEAGSDGSLDEETVQGCIRKSCLYEGLC